MNKNAAPFPMLSIAGKLSLSDYNVTGSLHLKRPAQHPLKHLPMTSDNKPEGARNVRESFAALLLNYKRIIQAPRALENCAAAAEPSQNRDIRLLAVDEVHF